MFRTTRVALAITLALGLSGCSLLSQVLPRATVTVAAPVVAARASETPRTTPTALSWQEVLERSRASVARIHTTSCDGANYGGTGFVVGDRLVMTAAHVVADQRTAAVQLSDGRLLLADLVDFDWQTDSALLRTRSALAAAPLTLTKALPPQGLELAVLGFPLDVSEINIARGLVSSHHKPVDFGSYKVPDASVTDAAMNPGNSGGPVVDNRGQVIGLAFGGRAWTDNTEDAAPVSGMNYFVPATILGENLAEWQDARVRGFTACDDDEVGESSEGGLAVEVTSPHEDAEALAGVLAVHGESINQGSYTSAWNGMTPAMQRRMKDKDAWAAGLSSSFWVDLVVTAVTRQGVTATVGATLTTHQGTAAGFQGQTCSVHRMQYTMVWSNGVWLMDRASRPEPPTAC